MATKAGEIKEKGWETVQIKAFTAWINNILTKREMQITEIKSGLSDGVKLINFLELLSSKKVTQKYDTKPPSRIQSIQNLHIALQFLEKQMEMKSSTSAEDFADHNMKMILGFMWSLFKKYRIQTIKQDDKSSEEGLLLWCKKQTEGYKDVSIETYKMSFRDGLAFIALCDKYVDNKELMDFSKFHKENNIENLGVAFEFAEKHLGIPKLLDPQEVADGNIDERSLVLYISLYFHAFVALQQKSQIEARMRGLQGTLEERAKLAENLQEENDKLKSQLEELRAQLKAEQEAKSELQEKDTYLEEKVEVLKQLLEQESEEKDEIEKAKQTLTKELDEVKLKFDSLLKEKEQTVEVLEAERKKGTQLTENKVQLQEQVSNLQAQLSELNTKLANEAEKRKNENDEYGKRSKAEVSGLQVLKKNLEQHVEDLTRWQKFLDLDNQSEIDFSGEIRPNIMLDISKQDYEAQVEYLAKKLDKENSDLEGFLKQKEAEVKARKNLEKKKKEKAKKEDD